MKLYYFKDPAGNFGDDLNPWLWQRLIPDLLDDDESEWFVGIGTLLNHRLPANGRLHIMGSGAGYGEPMKVDSRVVFHAVRGHLTAQALGLPASSVVTDAAVLIRRTEIPGRCAPKVRVGVMFTGQSLDVFDWLTLCEQEGYLPISCHWPVDRVLKEMQRCELLLTEAMHGAIVADALRIPWVPIVCNDGILAAKWQDWLSALKLDYEPAMIQPLFDVDRGLPVFGRLRNVARRSAFRLGISTVCDDKVLAHKSDEATIKLALEQLRSAAKRHGQLSNDDLLDLKLKRYDELINGLRRSRSP